MTRLPFASVLLASSVKRLGPHVEREAEQFRLLSRSAVRGLLSAATLSQESDPAQFALWTTVLISTPPSIYAFRQLLRYSALKFSPYTVIDAMVLTDRMFFVLYGMLAAALLAAVLWEALLPDRTDEEVIGCLPVRPRTIAAARLAAALFIVTMFSLAISLPAGVMLAVAAPSHPALGFLPVVLVAHVLTTMGGSLFVFVTLLIARGAIAFCMGERASERFATLLQVLTVTALAEVFFFIPSVLPGLIARMIDGDAAARALPPVWFAALYSWLVGTPHALLASAALLPPPAFATAMALVIVVYLAPAALLARRTRETELRHHAGLMSQFARGAAVVLPGSTEVRSILVFTIASLFRSRRHRLIVTAYAGLAIAIGTMTIIAGSIRGTMSPEHPAVSLLALPLVLMFFVTLGLRTAFSIPTIVEANWTFRLVQPPVTAAIDAARIAILLVALVPIAAGASAGAFVLGWGYRTTATVGLIDVLSAVVLVEWALADWRKVPFTCAHAADAESLKSRWLRRIVPLILFAFVNAAVQRSALQSTRALLWYVGVAVAAIALLRTRQWLTARRATLQFDESRGDEMATLSLSEALG